MPSISMFYGIVIYMYPHDHLPPHFHARYQGQDATFTFDGELRDGEIPPKQRKLVAAWAVLHSDELQANWELACDHQDLYKIKPL